MRATSAGFTVLVLFLSTVVAQVPAGRDAYGGLLAGHTAAQATGTFHIAKQGDRWMYWTPPGNPFYALSVDNIRLTNQLGVNAQGKGYADIVASKYAIGQGPHDGFTDYQQRWGWYTRQRLLDWGFTALQYYSYYPVVPDEARVSFMGNKPNNLMPYTITHNNSAAAMAAGAKNLYASVRTKVGGSPYFADPFDPKFATSAHVQAKSLAGHSKDRYVMAVFTGEGDELRGMESSHPHLGFIVAASNPAVSSDANAWGGARIYKDAKFYAKYALHDYLASKYPDIAALNAAWGTRYTTFDSAGDWGTGTGFMDENGADLPKWYRSGPAMPGDISHPAMAADLDAFAAQLIRKYYGTLYQQYRAVTSYPLISTNMAAPWSYVLNGMVGTDGTRYVDIVNIAVGAASDMAYAVVGRPVIAQTYAIADNDSPVALKGTVSAVTDLGSGSRCGANEVQITCGACDFWWYNAAPGYIAPWANLSFLKFSQVLYYQANGQPYLYFFGKFLDARNFTVCPYDPGQHGNKAFLLSNLHVGDTFKRIDGSLWKNTLDTQEARGDSYAGYLNSAFNRQSHGDYYVIGIAHWDWTDNNWNHSLYHEIRNYGIVTQSDNAYDGVQAGRGPSTDAYGFDRGGESADYGDFLRAVTAANRQVFQLLLPSGSRH